MFLRTELLNEKKLVGQYLTMSFDKVRTTELWKGFMPKRKDIKNQINNDLISAEVFPPFFFEPYLTSAEFQKWAAVEVRDFDQIPADMLPLLIPQGHYAVFLHKGPAALAERTYRFIFKTWLPSSVYKLDDRPHFAVMGEKYLKDHPESEEEIWIPVRVKVQ